MLPNYETITLRRHSDMLKYIYNNHEVPRQYAYYIYIYIYIYIKYL